MDPTSDRERLHFPTDKALVHVDGIEMDKLDVVRSFTFSADQEDAHAQFNYGHLLFRGVGVEMNKPLAAYYFKLSADQGHVFGQLNYCHALRR
jgi:TPR repeat protein